MDGYSGKRGGTGVVLPRKGSSLILKDGSVNQKDRNAKCCSRIGCSSRLNSMKGAHIGASEKAKSSTPSFRSSSSGKEIIGSSSGASSVGNTRKTSANSQKKLLSQVETDSSETSSVLDEPEVSESISHPGKAPKGLNVVLADSSQRDVGLLGGESSSVPSNARPRRNFNHRYGLGNQDSLPGSSFTLANRSTSQTNRANAGRYGLRNLRCNLVSDVVQSSCSSSDSNVNRRKDIFKKRISDGECSSSGRGKKMSGSLSEGRASNSSYGVSITDSGRARNCPANRDATAASVRTRRLISGYGRTRLSSQGNGNGFALSESNDVIPQVARPEMPTDLNALSSAELTSARIFNLPGNNAEGLLSIVPSSPSDLRTSRASISREGFRRYNMDGIAEVLLALERMEQDEELTYEQLLVLETSLLLNGLSFYDQHRDMRLDIDDMTYEELLALEERMGTVSTALSEETLSKCLKTSTFELASKRNLAVVQGGDKDDIKCSICQEEYGGGDELGSLRCEHRYHVACIQQWLRVKNRCPICKASAEHSPSSSSSSSPAL